MKKANIVLSVLLILLTVSCSMDKSQELIVDGAISLYEVNETGFVLKTNYHVTGENLDYQEDVIKQQELLSLLNDIFTDQYIKKVGEVLIFNAGEENVDAYIVNLDNSLDKFRVAIAINQSYDSEKLTYNLVHELGHVIALNNTQAKVIPEGKDCNNYSVDRVCTLQDSYLNLFYQKYWNAFDLEDSAIGSKSMFVTDYAQVSPIEDFAETFAHFVLYDIPSKESDKFIDKKIRFFTNFKELLKVRDSIRHNNRMD